MRILVAHNRYRSTAPSGENRVVDQERAALTGRGHDVELFERHSDEIEDWTALQKATLPARVIWNPDQPARPAAGAARFRPDVVHVHNTFPLLSPSVLYACRDAGVPVVVTLHNYKLLCASGDFFRDGAVCHDCAGGNPVPGWSHRCYRGSRLATVPTVVAARRAPAGMAPPGRRRTSSSPPSQRELLAGMDLDRRPDVRPAEPGPVRRTGRRPRAIARWPTSAGWTRPRACRC